MGDLPPPWEKASARLRTMYGTFGDRLKKARPDYGVGVFVLGTTPYQVFVATLEAARDLATQESEDLAVIVHCIPGETLRRSSVDADDQGLGILDDRDYITFSMSRGDGTDLVSIAPVLLPEGRDSLAYCDAVFACIDVVGAILAEHADDVIANLP
jgi:hypothetical protein